MGGLGPMAGQNHHFNVYAQEKIKYAIDRYVNETNRLYGVLNKRLADREFIARRLFDRRHGELSLGGAVQEPEPEHRRLPASEALAGNHPRRGRPRSAPTPRRKRSTRISARPAIRTDEERKILFGQTAAVRAVAEAVRGLTHFQTWALVAAWAARNLTQFCRRWLISSVDRILGAALLPKKYFAYALVLCCLASPAEAAGIQLLDSDPILAGAIWYPCAGEPQHVAARQSCGAIPSILP